MLTSYNFAGEEERGIGDDSFGFGNSLFKTGSGKRVTISSNGLVRAKTLLGLKQDINGSTVQSPQHSIREAYDRQQQQQLPQLPQLRQVKDSCNIMSVVPCQSTSAFADHALPQGLPLSLSL